MRKTLFYAVWRQIKYCEFKNLSNQDEDSFALESIVAASDGGNESVVPADTYLENLIETYWSKEKQRGRLLQTQKWTIEREKAGGVDDSSIG